MQDHAVVAPFDAFVLFVVADERAELTQMVGEGVDDLVVEKLEQLAARVDQVELDAERAKDRGVLAADDAGAVDRDRLRRGSQAEDRLAVEDAWVGEVDVGRPIRARPGGDDGRIALKTFVRPALLLHLDGMWVDEHGVAVHQAHAVAVVESLAQPDLGGNHCIGAAQQLRKADPFRDEQFTEHGCAAQLLHPPDDEAQRLARNRARVRAAAADLWQFVQQED